jgi:hypothetical protein
MQLRPKITYLGIVLCVPCVQGDRLEIKPTFQIDSRDDVPGVLVLCSQDLMFMIQ